MQSVIPKPIVPQLGEPLLKADQARVLRLKRAEKRRIMEDVIIFAKRGDL